MKRRELIALLGGAAAILPLAARAQRTALPVIGFLRNTDAASSQPLVAAFRHGLAESGYVEGRNVTVEYRWADNHDDRLPALADDLVKRGVAVIAAGGGTLTALAAKAATQTIPVVFELGGDPVKLGLVTSLNRPSGNLTGVALFANLVDQKRMELLHNLIPKAKTIGFLVNSNPNTEGEINEAQEAAKALGIRIEVLRVDSKDDIDAAFASLRRSDASALIVTPNTLFVANRNYLVSLAARNAIPAMYSFPSFPKAGGLISYGDDLTDAFRQVGTYAGRILKGEQSSDLPVIRPTKLELVINLKTAKVLGLVVPSTLLATADEVIE